MVAVHGNDDTAAAQRELPYQQLVTVNGQRLLIWHSHYQNRVDELHARRNGSPRDGLYRNIARAKSAGAKLIHFGHWHTPLLFEHEGITAVNAGAIASGNPFQQQMIQTVALLFMLRDGRFHITHVNLAEPERPFTDLADVDAGFEEALAKYGRSILAPDLEPLRTLALSEIYRTDPGAFLDVFLPLAHQVWAGEKTHVSLADLKVAVETADIKEGTRERLTAVLEK